MKKIFSTAWKILCIIIVCSFIISSLSSFIAPSAFSLPAVFGLAFPYILAVYILCCITVLFTNRKMAVLMLLVLPLGYFNLVNTFAIRTATPWQVSKDSSTLRVMTWNVQNFVNNLRKESAAAYADSKEGMLQTIHEYNPDVFCIQEYRNTENARRRPPVRKELDSLGYTYYYCSNDKVTPLAKNKKAIVTEGAAIYSKLPLLDSGRININHADKNENLIYADVILNNKRVRIFTAHLQSFYIYQDTAAKYEDENIYEITYKEKGAASYKIRETEINHEAEVKIIRKAIEASPYPVIYCGDMNITPTSYNYRLLRGKNLQDAFLQKGSGIGNTFYKIGPTLRIDVCLPDTALQVLQCKREARKLSDHYPVIADLQCK
jgi:endonuclease/exonuclease/phosphatase family metal-dependent hydrolase